MDFKRVLAGFWEAFGRDLEPHGQFLDGFMELILNFNYTLKVENQFHRKKEVPREDLEGFGDDFGRLLGEAQMHFRLEISSIEIDVLWNWFLTLSVSCDVFPAHATKI